MIDQLPILQVLLPLVAAPLAFLAGRPTWSWAIASLATLGALAVAIALKIEVDLHTTLVYAMGGWAAPIGIEYSVDALSELVLLLVTVIAAVITLFAPAGIAKEVPADRQPLFYAMLLLNIAGMLGMTITGDVFNLFVFLEINALSTYVLISLGRDRRAVLAAFQYLIIGTVGATFYLIGVGLLYMMTGSLSIPDLAARIPEVADSSTVRTAMAFFLVGLGIKLGMVPLHFWLPNAYSFAPAMVSALIAATATKVAVYVMMRVIFTLFGVEMFNATQFALVVLVLGLVAMFAASAVAIYQQNIKRMLAYSSLAQIGYMLLGIGLATSASLTAASLHLFNHALMKGALFLCLAAVFLRVGSVQLPAMAGLGRAMPWTMGAFVLAGLSIIGVPGTVGFVSKWYLVLATVRAEDFVLSGLILASSLLAVIYVWRVVEVAYLQPRPADAPVIREAPLSLLIPIYLLVLANIGFGVAPAVPVDLAQRSAQLLLGGGQ